LGAKFQEEIIQNKFKLKQGIKLKTKVRIFCKM